MEQLVQWVRDLGVIGVIGIVVLIILGIGTFKAMKKTPAQRDQENKGQGNSGSSNNNTTPPST